MAADPPWMAATEKKGKGKRKSRVSMKRQSKKKKLHNSAGEEDAWLRLRGSWTCRERCGESIGKLISARFPEMWPGGKEGAWARQDGITERAG